MNTLSLGGPGAIGMGGHAEDVHVPGRYFHDEQHAQPAEAQSQSHPDLRGRQPDPARGLRGRGSDARRVSRS
jgi:hypothetical protein